MRIHSNSVIFTSEHNFIIKRIEALAVLSALMAGISESRANDSVGSGDRYLTSLRHQQLTKRGPCNRVDLLAFVANAARGQCR